MLQLTLIAVLISVFPLTAQTPAPSPTATPPGSKPSAPPEEKLSRTKHTVTIDGRRIAYTATTGNLLLRTEQGAPRASIFFIAYTLDDTGIAQRPLTFSFNGGPGSSSVWLHLGTLGPRRVVMNDADAPATAPPYRVTDNEFSILDKTDLVFIDPVMTGYSRPVGEESPKSFLGFKNDMETVGEFIRLYTTRYQRWGSPKYLIGESYGTTRAAALSNYLQSRHGMYLNGVMLVSSILNFQTARFEPGNDLPYILFLPTYTATAWYHRQLDPDLQRDLRATLAEVENFAMGDYTLALMKGNDLPDEQKKAIASRVARYTGLSPDYIERSNLRINIARFVKELMRDQRQTVGRLDSRFKGIDRDAAGERYDYDPSYAAIQGPYTGALGAYLRGDLGYENDIPYEILTDRVRPWSYADFENRYVNTAEDLREAMTQNPNLRVFIASGYYDLATPYFATDYTFDHLAFDPGYTSRVTTEYYEAGHMMYVHMPSLEKLKRDLDAFLTGSAR